MGSCLVLETNGQGLVGAKRKFLGLSMPARGLLPEVGEAALDSSEGGEYDGGRAPAPKKRRGFCSGKKAEDIVQQTGQKIKLEYCPRLKGPSARGINSFVAHDIGCAIRSLVGMRYEWDENDEAMFNWILMRAQERYKDWKYHCHKAYLKKGSSGMPSDFIGRDDQWDFYASTSSQMRSRDSPWQTSGTAGRRLCTTTRGLLLSSTQWRNSEYKGSNFQLSKVLRRPMSGSVMKIRPRNI
ncbi:PREDICTED: uncharacterized protein LOC101303282 [Fragaria vesca subsp. vesca]